MLCCILFRNAKCRYAKCRNAACRGAILGMRYPALLKVTLERDRDGESVLKSVEISRQCKTSLFRFFMLNFRQFLVFY